MIKVVFAQPEIHSGEWNALTSLGFGVTNCSPNLGQTTRSSDNQQKREPAKNGHCCTGRKKAKREINM